MFLGITILNIIVAIVLYYFSLNGINHFIDNSESTDEEKSKDEFKLKVISTFLLLILLCGNVIIYYNITSDESGTVDVVEKK